MEARLHTLLDSAFDAADGVPGAILRVEAPGRGLVWEEAVGDSDPLESSALRPTQPLRIASMTKMYVAAAVLRLEEDGALGLDDPVAGHLLPATVGVLRGGGYDPSAITVRMLLQHTSGLADHSTSDGFMERIVREPRHRWSRREQLALAMEATGPVAAPGSRFRYSDTGYILLGELLEKTTGVPLHRALRQLLSFEDLGLTATWLESAEPAPAQALPRAHQYLGDIDTYAFDPSMDLFGGGGLVSTLEEVSEFVRALFAGEVFREPATLERMIAVTPESVPVLGAGYGMGIARVQIAGVDCYGHGGFWGTVVRYCPGAELAVTGAVTGTSGRDMLDALVRQVLVAMLT